MNVNINLYEDFLNHKLFVEFTKNDISQLTQFEDLIGNRKYPSGARMSVFTLQLLREYESIGICCSNNKIFYSRNDYKQKRYVTIDEFFGYKSINLNENEFESLFEG